jgi:hypothetical protein
MTNDFRHVAFNITKKIMPHLELELTYYLPEGFIYHVDFKYIGKYIDKCVSFEFPVLGI